MVGQGRGTHRRASSPTSRRPSSRRTARSRSPSTPAYAEQLLGSGSLGDDDDFKDAVPHADDSLALAYVSFDNDWTDALQDLAKDEDDPEPRRSPTNLAALRAFGASAWTDGDTGHALVRLTLK